MPKVVPEYKEKAKQRIIEAAIGVFAQKGYHRTSMDNIAEVLGVSKGAIYQYFKSKQQLFFDVFESVLVVQKDEVMSIILSDNPMYIASEEFFDTKIGKARSFGLDMFLEAARNETVRNRMIEIYDRSYVEFTGHIESLKKQGVIKKSADVGIVWRGLIALRDGLLSSVFLGADPSNAKKTWNKLSSLLLKEILV